MALLAYRIRDTSFKIAPNPAVASALLEYDLGEAQTGVIKVFDMLGIKRGEWRLPDTKGSVVFDAGILPSGHYVAVLFADGKAVKQQVLIKK